MKNNWRVVGTGSEDRVKEAGIMFTPTNGLGLAGPGGRGVREE